MPKASGIYQEHRMEKVEADGPVTVYTPKIHKDMEVQASIISAWGNQAVANEVTRVGVEVGGTKHYYYHVKLQKTDEILTFTGQVYAKKRDRFFVEFEAANKGEELHLCVNGRWEIPGE